MKIKCPFCKTELELPAGVQEGRHLRCAVCDRKFSYKASRKMPLQIKISCVLFYIIYILGALDTLAGLVSRTKTPVLALGYVGTLALQIYVIVLVNNIRQRQNKTRVILSALHSVILLLGVATLIAVKAGIIWISPIALLSAPLVLLWLPQSNRWFRT